MRTVYVQRVSKALFIRPLRRKHAVHSLPTSDVFHNPDTNYCFFHAWIVRRLCVTWRKTSENENRTNLERVLYLCLALHWCWSDVLLTSTFTRRKTFTFLNMQKMCAEVDAYNK